MVKLPSEESRGVFKKKFTMKNARVAIVLSLSGGDMVTHTWNITQDMVEAYKRSYGAWDRMFARAVIGPYKTGYGAYQEPWIVNKKDIEQKKRDKEMEEFLMGMSEELRKRWEGKSRQGVDVTEEMKELLDIYHKKEQHVREVKDERMNSVVWEMKNFIEAFDAHVEIQDKLEQLKNKLKATGFQQKENEDA